MLDVIVEGATQAPAAAVAVGLPALIVLCVAPLEYSLCCHYSLTTHYYSLCSLCALCALCALCSLPVCRPCRTVPAPLARCVAPLLCYHSTLVCENKTTNEASVV